MTRHHAESNINILLTKNIPFGSDVRQRSHTLMMPLHCLWAKSNNRTRGQFECDVTWFWFCFDFVCSHARWGCCSIVCWRGCVWGEGVVQNWTSKVQGGGKILDVHGQWAGGSWKLDNFHGRHMCIVLMRANLQIPENLPAFTKEKLNGTLHFLCSYSQQ